MAFVSPRGYAFQKENRQDPIRRRAHHCHSPFVLHPLLPCSALQLELDTITLSLSLSFFCFSSLSEQLLLLGEAPLFLSVSVSAPCVCVDARWRVLDMEKKQGFFSALKDEVVRGLSPSRSRSRPRSRSRAKSPGRSASPMGGLFRRRKGGQVAPPELLISRSGNLMMRPVEALSPLMEGPDPDGAECGDSRRGHWMRAPSVSSSSSAAAAAASKQSDLRLLLGVLGAPLAPVHVAASDPLPHLSIKNIPIVSSLSFSLSRSL